MIPDWSLSISQGGIRYYKNIVNTENLEWQRINAMIEYYEIDKEMPLKDIDRKN